MNNFNCYFPVDIDNFSIIQEKIYNLFPQNFLDKTILFYPKNNLEIFLSIPELKEFLIKSGYIKNLSAFAFFILQGNSNKIKQEIIHIDTGNYNYSLNLPIKNCNNTYTYFYSSNDIPKLKRMPHGDDYLELDKKNCKLIDRLELTSPHVINVKIPHSIINNNTDPRISLLIRLNNIVI